VDHAVLNRSQLPFAWAARSFESNDPSGIKIYGEKFALGVDFFPEHQKIYEVGPAHAFIVRARRKGWLYHGVWSFAAAASERHATFLHHEVPGIEIPNQYRTNDRSRRKWGANRH
jgi:hypothetical protein